MMKPSDCLRDAPDITVFVFAYNQQAYVRAACESVLAQDYDAPLEIIFSDDCSSDNTFQIMTDVAQSYRGMHSIRLNRNQQNIGLIRHVNLSHQLATGDLLIAAAGDDISLPNRVTAIVDAYRKARQQPLSIYSDVRMMSAEGEPGGLLVPPIRQAPASLEACATSGFLIVGASHAWHRSLFEVFGDIQELGAYEDLVLAYRSALLGGLVYINQPLVNYRLGTGVSGAGKYAGKKAEKKKAFRKDQMKDTRVMLAVLRQRLQDTVKIKAEPRLVDVLEKEISKNEIQLDLLAGNAGFLMLLKRAFSVSATLHFLRFRLKLWRKEL